jgi:hypothetical protein
MLIIWPNLKFYLKNYILNFSNFHKFQRSRHYVPENFSISVFGSRIPKFGQQKHFAENLVGFEEVEFFQTLFQARGVQRIIFQEFYGNYCKSRFISLI